MDELGNAQGVVFVPWRCVAGLSLTAVKIAGAEDAGQHQRLFFLPSTDQWYCFESGCAPSRYQQSQEQPDSVGALVG